MNWKGSMLNDAVMCRSPEGLVQPGKRLQRQPEWEPSSRLINISASDDVEVADN